MLVYQICLCFEDGGLTTNYMTAPDPDTARRHFAFWVSRHQAKLGKTKRDIDRVELWSFEIGGFNLATGLVETHRVEQLATIEFDQWTLAPAALNQTN